MYQLKGKTKVVAWVVCLILLVGVVSACSSTSTPIPSEANPENSTGEQVSKNVAKEIVIMQNRSPETPIGKSMIKTVEQYQKQVNPNFTVDFQYVPEMISYKQKIKTLIASNEIPNMFNMDPDPYASILLREGYLLDITEISEKHGLAELFYEAPFKWGSFADGTQIGLPIMMAIEVFWYNKEIFSQAGVEPPETMDQFLGVCQTLKDHGIIPLAMSGKEPWTVLRYFTMMSFRLEGNSFIDGLVRGDRKMGEPTGMKVAKFVRDMGVGEYFQPGFASIDQTTAINYFAGGGSAMYYSGSHNAGVFVEGLGEHLDYFRLPILEGGPSKANEYIAHGGTPICFSKPNFDETMEDFLVFFARNYGVNLSEYLFSPRVGCNLPDDTNLTKKIAMDIQNGGSPVRLVDVFADPSTNELMNKEIISLALGEITIEEFCSRVDESIAHNASKYFR